MSKPALPMLVAAVIALAGCGLRDPYSQQPQKRPAAAGAQSAQAPVPEGALKPTSSATTMLARYADAWVNWSAATLPHERAALLALATGQLAEQLRQDAAQAVKTQLQEVSQSYSRGRYVGLITQQGEPAVVVTYEEVAPLGGQAQGAYHVYLARTEHTALGWKVTEWQPATDS
jgi:predicted small lipoprotein YifL